MGIAGDSPQSAVAEDPLKLLTTKAMLRSSNYNTRSSVFLVVSTECTIVLYFFPRLLSWMSVVLAAFHLICSSAEGSRGENTSTAFRNLTFLVGCPYPNVGTVCQWEWGMYSDGKFCSS